MRVSKKITVSGKVQDVWFRKYTSDKANEIGVTGTVRNLPNGDVLIHAQGTEQQVQQLEKWCWQGSPLSKVTHVSSEETDLEDHPDFRIIE